MALTSFAPGTGLGTSAGITAYTNTMTDAALGYISSLGQLTLALNPPTINPEWPTIDAAPAPLTAEPPIMQEIVWSLPSMPAPFTGTLEVDDYLPEPFDEDPPVLQYGVAPTAPSDPLPDAPGISLVYEEPTLDLSLPAAPSLLSLSIRPFDGLSLPTIDTTLPELTAVAPSVVPYTPGSLYTSGLLTALQDKLTTWLTSGGSGLNPDVENAIWDRAREREYRLQADALLELERMETLGYSLPPGIYVDARLKVTTEISNNMAGASREIAIKQAELELEGIRQAITSAVPLEQALIQSNNNVEQRAFEAARYATEAGISIYNAKVQAYGAYVEAYRAKIAIYEAQVRAEVSRVEAYRAEIAAEEAKAQINTALVQQYRVQADVALANVEIYKARIDAIRTKAEIEKLKVEIFGEQVRGYTAKVNAYTAGVEGFRATVQAESAKQEAYRSRVQAYTAQVDAGAKQIDARVSAFRALIEAKGAELDGYRATVQAESARVDAIAQNNQSLGLAFRAEVDALNGYNEAMTKQWQVAVDQAQRVSEIAISAAKANAELYITTRSLALDAAKVGAQVTAQLGAAALSAINWSQSYSLSFANSESVSSSTSENVNENYNYSV